MCVCVNITFTFKAVLQGILFPQERRNGSWPTDTDTDTDTDYFIVSILRN